MIRRPVIVYTVHNNVYGKKAFSLIERMLVPFTDHTITVSKSLYDTYLRVTGTGEGKVSLINNGIDIERFKRGRKNGPLRGHCPLQGHFSPEGDMHLREDVPLERGPSPAEEAVFVVGTVARLVPSKGVDVLLRAIPDVVKAFPRSTFLIVGDGPLRGELEVLAKSLDIDSHVKFLGFRKDIPELLESLDLFVLPTLAEGMPLSLLEAMASGVPVVATAVGGIPEVIADGVNGRLVPPGDASSLASAIVELLRDRELARSLANRARELVAKSFNVNDIVRKTEELYLALMAEIDRVAYR